MAGTALKVVVLALSGRTMSGGARPATPLWCQETVRLSIGLAILHAPAHQLQTTTGLQGISQIVMPGISGNKHNVLRTQLLVSEIVAGIPTARSAMVDTSQWFFGTYQIFLTI